MFNFFPSFNFLPTKIKLPCTACYGTGFLYRHSWYYGTVNCSTCNGTGSVDRTLDNFYK